MLDTSNKAILVINKEAMPKAGSKIVLNTSSKAILVIDKGAMPDASRKVALVIEQY